MAEQAPRKSDEEAAAEDNENRRQHSRATLKTSVNLFSDSNFYTGFTDDISEGGIFIATHDLAPQGAVFDLEFSLPDDEEPVRVRGEVRWVRVMMPESDVQPGMGIRFHNLQDRDRDRILAFVKHRDTIFYDD